MRNIFAKKLVEHATLKKNVYLLTADLGFNCFEDFQKKFPERFINIGIAENNMLGIATGLAMQGKEVYVYSIIPFLLYKSFEHIKNYISTYDLNIKLIGAGGGFSYGAQGISHNPIEDLGILNLLPWVTNSINRNNKSRRSSTPSCPTSAIVSLARASK